jgi:uncharacterized protein (TIGR02453 family)
MTATRHFTPATFAFMRDLAANNNREWFNANKTRYEEVLREPALEFIRDFEPLLSDISPYFRADDRKVGGSLFRIYRDVRFSRDKSPYKTYTGVQFRHVDGKDAHAPGFYLHLQPRTFFIGLGIWHPDSLTLAKIRAAIHDDPDGWQQALDAPAFGDGFALRGDTLKRPPRGFAAEHPLIEDLKRKDFIAVKQITQKEVTSGGFVDRFAATCAGGSPFLKFLCDAIDVTF